MLLENTSSHLRITVLTDWGSLQALTLNANLITSLSLTRLSQAGSVQIWDKISCVDSDRNTYHHKTMERMTKSFVFNPRIFIYLSRCPLNPRIFFIWAIVRSSGYSFGWESADTSACIFLFEKSSGDSINDSLNGFWPQFARNRWVSQVII